MTVSVESRTLYDISQPEYYGNRELSWLRFNDRVLHEALDPRTPLLERLKFLAIFSTNLDEFFMVRVSGLLDQVQAGVTKRTADGLSPQQQLDRIYEHLLPVITQQHKFLHTDLQPLMAQAGIHLVTAYKQLSAAQQEFLDDYFSQRIFPILTPLGIDPSHPFPRMSNLSLNIAVEAIDPETKTPHYARIKVPSNLPRFISFPDELKTIEGEPVDWVGIPLEEVITHHLDALFPGMTIQQSGYFRITRDADFPILEVESDDLLLTIQQEISKRRLEGDVIRLEMQRGFPENMMRGVIAEYDLSDNQIYTIDGLLNLSDLLFFLSLPCPELKDPPWTPAIHPRLKFLHPLTSEEPPETFEAGRDIFDVIRERDVLVHHPYQGFHTSVELLITHAAHDPHVQAIKMTLYRTSGDSPVVQALLDAVENGKQVAVLVELKARFDEENNIHWAKRLEQAGIHVVYGVIGLKTHTKVLLIVRQEEKKLRRYVHIGTGNYNSKTAKLYTDLGLMSCREELGADLSELFNFLTAFSRQRSYRKLLIAPVTLRDHMMAMIRRETEHCHNGQPGRIIAKMNSLVDPAMIKLLYEASQAGVEIDLIIRGICCLKPGIEGVSENIRVISIIGRFLEHSRVFYFQNDGDEQIFIGSADWMPRNLDRRVEAVVPIEDPILVTELKDLLQILLADNRQAWEMQSDGSYVQRHPASKEPERSAQVELMQQAIQQSTIRA